MKSALLSIPALATGVADLAPCRLITFAELEAYQRAYNRDPLEILKWKEVYEGLEEACDGCKDFTHALGNVVIKNA